MRAAAFRAPLRARGMPSHRRPGVSAAAPVDHGLIMPREPLRLREGDPLWVFGYGSIVWKVGFAYTERKICCARGWRRRFYQGSTDHRGTTAFPGRTVTLERCDPVEDPPCWGAAYRVAPEDVEATLANLEVREKQYDLRAQFDLHESADADAPVVVRDAVTWLATSDPANLNWLGEPEGGLEEMAETIANAVGPSGRNTEYLYELAEALRGIGVEDDHLYELEARVRAIETGRRGGARELP